MTNHAMSYRLANMTDIPLLAEMNLQLIQDEGSDNPMKLEQLAERMAGFLQNDWQAAILLKEEQSIGYALYQARPHPLKSERSEIYIRQYFIDRRYRTQGVGRKGMELLEEQLFPKGSRIAIDVLHHNEAGHAFWSSIGFKPYAIHMKRELE